MRDYVQQQELNEYWGGTHHTNDLELEHMIDKLDAILEKGRI
jgi:hypothetical protein